MEIEGEIGSGQTTLAKHDENLVFFYQDKYWIRVKTGPRISPNGGGKWEFTCFCFSTRELAQIDTEVVVESKPQARLQTKKFS